MAADGVSARNAAFLDSLPVDGSRVSIRGEELYIPSSRMGKALKRLIRNKQDIARAVHTASHELMSLKIDEAGGNAHVLGVHLQRVIESLARHHILTPRLQQELEDRTMPYMTPFYFPDVGSDDPIDIGHVAARADQLNALYVDRFAPARFRSLFKPIPEYPGDSTGVYILEDAKGKFAVFKAQDELIGGTAYTGRAPAPDSDAGYDGSVNGIHLRAQVSNELAASSFASKHFTCLLPSVPFTLVIPQNEGETPVSRDGLLQPLHKELVSCRDFIKLIKPEIDARIEAALSEAQERIREAARAEGREPTEDELEEAEPEGVGLEDFFNGPSIQQLTLTDCIIGTTDRTDLGFVVDPTTREVRAGTNGMTFPDGLLRVLDGNDAFSATVTHFGNVDDTGAALSPAVQTAALGINFDDEAAELVAAGRISKRQAAEFILRGKIIQHVLVTVPDVSLRKIAALFMPPIERYDEEPVIAQVVRETYTANEATITAQATEDEKITTLIEATVAHIKATLTPAFIHALS